MSDTTAPDTIEIIDNPDTDTVTVPVPDTKKEVVKKYFLQFTQNRSFELSIDNQRYFQYFAPFENIEVPGWILNHPDFENVKNLFLIKEGE